MRDDVQQTDIYQVCEYARKRGTHEVVLLYPQYRGEERKDDIHFAYSEGSGVHIKVRFARLPFVYEKEADVEAAIREAILRLFDIQSSCIDVA